MKKSHTPMERLKAGHGLVDGRVAAMKRSHTPLELLQLVEEERDLCYSHEEITYAIESVHQSESVLASCHVTDMKRSHTQLKVPVLHELVVKVAGYSHEEITYAIESLTTATHGRKGTTGYSHEEITYTVGTTTTAGRVCRPWQRYNNEDIEYPVETAQLRRCQQPRRDVTIMKTSNTQFEPLPPSDRLLPEVGVTAMKRSHTPLEQSPEAW